MHTLNAAHVLYRYSYIDESTFIVSRCLRKNIKNLALDFQGQFQNSRHLLDLQQSWVFSAIDNLR